MGEKEEPMKIKEFRGVRALCHDEECIQMDDADIDALSELTQTAAWVHLMREIHRKLSRKQRSILDRWYDHKVDLAGICAAS